MKTSRPAEIDRRRKLRETRKLLRLGSPPSPCVFCGYYSATSGLRPFRVSELAAPLRQKVLQRHHPDGRTASDFTVWVCVWCHAEESDAQYDLPPRLRHPRTQEGKDLAILAGNARLYRRQGEIAIAHSEWLERYVRERLEALDNKGDSTS